jgi:serine/threonine protein kinase
MSTQGSDLENELSKEKIKSFSAKALGHFNQSTSNNIYTSEDDSIKIVKLLTKDETPVYYLLVKKLGAGAFGEVSKAVQINIETGTIIPNAKVAIKITDFTQGGTVGGRDIPKFKDETIHENNILKMVDQSYGFSIGTRTKSVEIDLEDGTGDKITRNAQVQEAIVAMPLFPGRDIQHTMHKDRFSYGSITSIELATLLSSNLQNLHDKNIIHSDLKPANTIWDAQNGVANIVDYNKAKIISSNEQYVKDSSSSDKAYMAPECFAGTGGYQFSKASDVFSLGQILAEKFNITNQQTAEQHTLQNKHYLSYDQLITKKFINRMVSPNENQRPTAKECVQFFSSIEKKMKLDIEQPNNETRLAFSKKLIDLEVYANQLQKEINNMSVFARACHQLLF